MRGCRLGGPSHTIAVPALLAPPGRPLARFIGNYEVLSELGAGHFGTVYLAVGDVPGRGMQPGRRRLVAIKKLKNTRDPESLRLLLQEFALLDQVKHRSIVRVFEYLESEQAVVMEHIHGVTLRRVLDELEKAREQFFLEAAVEIGAEIADALYHAYTTPGDNGDALQLVHRDLKPDNVMLTPQGEVKILDWGLARVDNADFRRESKDRLRGTLMYMSPEQALNRDVDHRSDLFALGLILHELLMGRPVYGVPQGAMDPLAAAMRAIERGDTNQACADLEATMPSVGPIITRSLQPRPEDRYRNGQDLLVDLRRSLYRDRGAYLQEFCEFFFGTLYDPGPAPTLDGARTSGRGPRLSIEERLRRSMAEEGPATGSPDPAPPDRAPPPSGVAALRSSAGRAVAPPAASPRAPQSSGAEMAGQGSSGNGPPRPPVGGGASRAAPFKPGGPPAPSPRRAVGNRRPDETGMLEMVPLNSNDDEASVEGDPSATAFFAIPAPRAERGAPTAAQPMTATVGQAPPPPPMGRPSQPPSPAFATSGPPPMPSVGRAPPPPMGGPPMAPPMGGPPMGPPMGQMGGHQPMIQGPIAGYGGAQTPFQVQGPQPGDAGAASDKGRTQSHRVYALVLGVVFLVGVATLAAVWLRPGKGVVDGGETVATNSTAPVVNTTTEKKSKAKARRGDTGEAAPAPATRRNPPSGGGGSKKSSGGSTAAASSTPPAPRPTTSPASLTVTLAGAAGISGVEVSCPSGFRDRKSIASGPVVFSGVPKEACTLFFRGAAMAKYYPVSGGQNLNCTISGTQGLCN